ncbi:MAG: 4-hydroxybenzoate octaprenyltransferase [Nitrospirae bacterium GWC2_57_13]|nr:MAG: 4-hydroxybenzoate octaprenyltransferase [Nitrospirae bacterium GWC1_57_7]OGW29854.1 MAG: 4-hydroxybenzoate octaprenyltransferase [Nitrospirae bacterium GWC2_57_13]HAS54757.1 4-hydroxybenzoate octaprenyltransferase [Nitrospiraceae bacterium]
MTGKIKLLLEMIKFEHTIFALPFAFTGAVLAANGMPPWVTLFWITVAMVGARSAAMGYNRLVDREFDAVNPRTKDRALPLGLVTPRQVIIFTAVSSLLLVAASFMLNRLAFFLSPLALAVVFFYSYTKRFTAFSHAFLGLAISLAPIGAWIAVTGRLDAPALVLGIAVLFWLVGFDVLYALQDVEFDNNAGLHSIPRLVGVRRALWISRAAHAVTVVALIVLSAVLTLGWFYLLGVIIAAGLLVYEHSLVKEDDLSKLNIAFFNMNGYLSVAIFLFTLLEVLL